jgi:hypothetical protein
MNLRFFMQIFYRHLNPTDLIEQMCSNKQINTYNPDLGEVKFL